MTPTEREAIRARLAAATPGPWRDVSDERERVGVNFRDDPGMFNAHTECEGATDAEFIAHAPADIAALLQEVERLEAARFAAVVEQARLLDHYQPELAALRAENARLRDEVAAMYRDKFPNCVNNEHCQSRREHGDGECGCFHDSLGMIARGETFDVQPQRLWTKTQVDAIKAQLARAVDALEETVDEVRRYRQVHSPRWEGVATRALNRSTKALAGIRTTEGGTDEQA